MRGSKWESVKPLLRTLQENFSSHIHSALLIKPDNFWQKHKTNLGSAKLSFQVCVFVCVCVCVCVCVVCDISVTASVCVCSDQSGVGRGFVSAG